MFFNECALRSFRNSIADGLLIRSSSVSDICMRMRKSDTSLMGQGTLTFVVSSVCGCRADRRILSSCHLGSCFSELQSDKWIRIRIEPSDLLVLPAGIYHRFTLDENNAVKVLRLFKVFWLAFLSNPFVSQIRPSNMFIYHLQENPKWVPHNRSSETDVNPYRTTYVRAISGTA